MTTVLRKLAALPLLALLAVPAWPAAATAAEPESPLRELSAQQVSPQDRAFLRRAAQVNAFEIRSGALALQRSRSEQVRRVARRLIRDHAANASQLARLARREGVTLPRGVDREQQRVLRRLMRVSRAQFDCAYLDAQIRGHLDAIALFQRERVTGRDRDVRRFASTSLPVLRSHLTLARQAARRLDCRR